MISFTLAVIAAFFPLPSTNVVLSLSLTTFLQDPKYSRVAFSSLYPCSSDIKVAPVKIAISSSIDFLLSPNPGAFTANTLNVPLNLLTTSVARASPSISSAIIRIGLPACTTFSSRGSRSFILLIFLS